MPYASTAWPITSSGSEIMRPNIAEAAIYLIEGKNIKHWPKPDEDLLLAGSEG